MPYLVKEMRDLGRMAGVGVQKVISGSNLGAIGGTGKGDPMQSAAQSRIMRPSDLLGVDLMESRLAAGIETGGVFARYAIGAIRGPVRYWCRGHWAERSGEYVMTVQPGEYVPSYIQGPLEASILFIDPNVLELAAYERGQPGRPYYSYASAADPITYQALRRVCALVDGQATALERQDAFTELLDLMLSHYVDKRRTISDPIVHRGVRRMRDLIHEQCAEDLTLDALAARAGLNKFYALRAFKHAVGAPPHTYQRHVRVARARELLRAGQSSTEVAHALGFCDQSHFVRCFRQITHQTPRQYQVGR
jgi:AraC-like DNA-binding protein